MTPTPEQDIVDQLEEAMLEASKIAPDNLVATIKARKDMQKFWEQLSAVAKGPRSNNVIG